MPPKNKSKNAPNQHDKRHESGLAAPGKRVAKQRSNGQLNGQPNGKPASTVPPPPLPSTGLNSGIAFPRPPKESVPASSAENHAANTAARDHVEATTRDRTSSGASIEEMVGPCGEMADNYHEPAPTAPHVEAQSAANKANPAPPAGSTLAIISTILTYYPLRDAISILILLLSLPPTLVLVIQTLFASLTFVPPTAGISLSTLPNIKEMFNASSLGYPALATILLVDLIFYLCWLPVWKPVQGMFLDLSQTVIAVSLSGAAASNGGPTYSIFTCSTIVCVVHVLRYKAIHLTALDYLRSVIQKMDIGFDVNFPSPLSTFTFSPSSTSHGWLYTAVRTMLGIHIVSQGVTTVIRRSLASANERSSNAPSAIKSDPEASAGTDASQRSISSEAVQNPSQVLSGDGRPPGPSPAHRESKVRESSNKKKRKQANQVRSQQPLWAAIASTKVTFVKEMEQRDAADDAKEAAAMDTNTTNQAFATSTTNSLDRIWISEVRDTDILFGVELSAQSAAESAERSAEASNISSGIDKTKPFFIRINGAAWSSTRIVSSATGDEYLGKCWEGEIFGLAPLSSYHCEVVGIESQQVLCSANLITISAPTAEQAASVPPQPQHQTLRPSSPITTLKQSIQQAEAKLLETRNRTKKSKKDQRAAHADVKREIALLKSKLESSGGMDDKQARRLQQITQHKNQAEEATADIKSQIQALGEIPSNELKNSEAKRRAWQSAVDARTAALKELENLKAEADKETKDLNSDISSTVSKREKLASRRQQRTEELDHAVSKQQADLSARQRRDLERAQAREEQDQAAAQLQFHINKMHAEIEAFDAKTSEAYQHAISLQNWAAPGYQGYSSTPTGDASYQGSISPVNGFGTYGPMSFPQPFQPGQAPATHAPRGRSSSMLSQYSGFTENGEEYGDPYQQPQPQPQPQHHIQYIWGPQGNAVAGAAVFDDRNTSEGSGSGTNGSTASNSPRPDATAKPFVPAARPSPIGPPRKKTPQSAGSGLSNPGPIGGGR